MPGPNGPVTEMRSAYVELGSGMHRLEGQNWVESSDELELFQGGAIARKGQHQLILSPSIADVPAIDMQLGGTRLQSRIFGIAYFCAATGRSVLLGEIKESIGELTARNECTWTDCFTDGIKADVRCTYRLNGIAVDVVLRGQLPDPAEWNIAPENCRVQVWTAFLDPPEATTRKSLIRGETDPFVRAAMHDPDFGDELIAFPDLHFTRGKAFAIETPPMQAAGINIEEAAAVGKQWVVVENIRYLIESVEWNSIADFMATLPVAANKGADNRALAGASPAGNGKRKTFASVKEMVASVDKSAIQRRADSLREKQSVGGTSYASYAGPTSNPDRSGTRVARPSNDPKRAIQIAQATAPRPGLVIDYTTLNSSLTNYTFEAQVTYYISAPVLLYGNSNVFDGNCVAKFAPTNSAKIDVKGKLIFNTDSYRPAVLTARDDHSQGEPVDAASLSGVYADTALRFDYAATNQLASVTNVKVMYARRGLEFAGGHGHEVRHAQFVNCGTAVYVDGGTVAIRNALGWNLTNALVGASSSTSTGKWEHATFNQVTNLVTTAAAAFTNCLVVGVVATNGLDGAGNSVVASSNGVFNVVGSGHHYLASGSVYRDVGVTNIDARLVAELRQRTTYPPLVLTNSIAINTTLTPQCGWDIDIPDLGWHYSPLDWWVCGVNVKSNVTLVLTNGVAIGMDYVSNSWAFILSNANLFSFGSPTLYNRIVRADTVQEKSGGNPGTRACFYDGPTFGSVHCDLRLQFTEFSQLAQGGYMVYQGHKIKKIEWSHCRFYNPLIVVAAQSSALNAGITNCLFERADINFSGTAVAGGPVFHLRNNLFRYRVLSLTGTNTWTFRDNLFESMLSLTNNGKVVQNSYNAYFNTTWGLSSGSNNTNLTSLTYETGSLGKYYQPASSILIGLGSQNATNAGFFHWCVTTNSVKETNSVVDIGLHYVAVGANGQPQDSDSDGVPDYLEDANGNGIVDSGETDWQNAGDSGLRVFITRPREGSHVP